MDEQIKRVWAQVKGINLQASQQTAFVSTQLSSTPRTLPIKFIPRLKKAQTSSRVLPTLKLWPSTSSHPITSLLLTSTSFNVALVSLGHRACLDGIFAKSRPVLLSVLFYYFYEQVVAVLLYRNCGRKQAKILFNYHHPATRLRLLVVHLSLLP